MSPVAEIMSGFSQRRPPPFEAQGKRSAAATSARRWPVAKYFRLRSFGRAERRRDLRMTRAFAFFVSAIFAGALGGWRAKAQDTPSAPLAPPPEHDVRRLGTEPEAAAPPSLPPDEIIRRFSAKEDQFLAARPNYGSRKTIRIDEFGEDGKPAGQFLMVTETTRAANGQVISKVVQKPQSTLHYFNLETEDVKELDRIPAFADEQPACEIRLEIYRRRTGGRDRLLHFQSEAEGAGSHARVFGRTCLGGYEVPGSGEDVREMGERAGRRAFGDAAVHAV